MTLTTKLGAALATSIALNAYLVWSPTSAPPATVQVAQVAPALKSEKKETVTCATVQTYVSSVKPKLPIPASVVADPNAHVAAASQVEASDRPTTITTVLDTSTGAFETYVAPAALPLFAFENRGEISVDYGVENAGFMLNKIGRANARWDFVQIKAINVGISISGFSDGHAFAGVGLSYRW